MDVATTLNEIEDTNVSLPGNDSQPDSHHDDMEIESVRSNGTTNHGVDGDGSKSPRTQEPDNAMSNDDIDPNPRPWNDLIDSDADSDNIPTSGMRSKRKTNLIDSDSESGGLPSLHWDDDVPDEDPPGEDLKSDTESLTKETIREGRVVRKSTWSDSESESTSLKSKKSSKAPSRSRSPLPANGQKPWMDLVDSDSEDDALPSLHNNSNHKEGGLASDGGSSDCLPSIHEDYGLSGNPTSSSNKKSGDKPAKKKLLTQKQREELVKETLSKTQQLIREKSVSLPYEKPKAMSLKEFLAKRAQAKAEFYNPELRKLRPPTPPPLDLTKLEEPLASKKVEGWVSDMRETDQLPPEEDPIHDSAVDDAFDKLDGFLMEDLSIVDDHNQKTQLENQAAMDGEDDDGSRSVPLVNLEENEETIVEIAPRNHTPVPIPDVIPTDPESFPDEDRAVPALMDFESKATAQAQVNPGPPVEIGDPTGSTLHEEVVNLLPEDDGNEVKEVEPVDDFKMKEAALEAYLEANKPKPPRRTIADILKSDPDFAKIVKLKPSLHPPGKGFIDFSSPKPKRNPRKEVEMDGLQNLKNRFLKHTAVKEKPTEQHFTVRVTTKEEDSQGNQKSTVDNVDYVQHLDNADDDQFNNTISPARQTPGRKFSDFREKLQAQIRSRKVKEYEEKMKQHSVYENEKMLDEKEPLDEAEEGLEEDDFTTESEPELTDEEAEAAAEARRKKKKKKLKSAFVDEEAEVSDSDQSLGDEADDESEEGSQESGEDMETDHEEVEKSKPFRRVKLIIDSSDEDDDGIELITLDEEEPSGAQLEPADSLDALVKEDPDDTDMFGEHGQRFLSQVDLFPIEMSQPLASPSQSQITPAQREIAKLIQEPILPSQSTPIAPPSISQFDDYVTSPNPWDFELSTKQSPIPYSSSMGRFDSEAALDSFRQEMPSTPSSQPLPNEIAKLVGDAHNECESPNLASICSGVFPSQNPFTPAESQCPGFYSQTPKSSDLNLMEASSGNDQITPRIEREKLNKTRLLFVELDKADVHIKKGKDDDEEVEPVGQIVKRKKRRRLQFSDDEDEEETKEEEDSEVDDEVEGDGEGDHEYDSEENEIVKPKPPVKGLVSKHGKIRNEFVENEAELSGSEEGSADEDERGLDQMDEEEGDDEQIDEESLRDHIGQQHIRNLMDDDARQVRHIQDLLLEDGDLHGDGDLREKQFKWKHIDNLDLDAGAVGEEGVAAQVEDEAERIWKEEKAEKARWIKENSQLIEEEEENAVEEDSQKLFLEKSKHFKLGKSTLKKIQSSCSFMEYSGSNGGNSCSESMLTETSLESSTTSMARRPGIHSQALLASPDDPILKVKRGSFLARGTSSLTKIAEMTKGTESTNSIKVNSRNFVFSVITPPGPDPEAVKGKRKNLARHPSNRNETQPRKMARVDRSFHNLDAARKAASIFSQY